MTDEAMNERNKRKKKTERKKQDSGYTYWLNLANLLLWMAMTKKMIYRLRDYISIVFDN
jgi:hypothetical protein